MDWLTHLFGAINNISKGNQLVATGISLWGLGTLTWAFKSVPSSLYRLIKRQCTTTLYLNNSTVGNNLENFAGFLTWFETNRWARYSRSLSINGTYSRHNSDDGSVVGIGDGTHYFTYNHHFFAMNRKRIENSSGFSQINYEITVTMFGRNRKILEDMIESFRYKEPSNKLGIYQFRENEWVRVLDIEKRDLRTVMVDPNVKASILDVITQFQQNEAWYRQRGLAYKKTFLLFGPPGSGKTSFIKALAGHFAYNVCRLNLSFMTDEKLEQALATAPKRAIILMEDFDSTSAVRARSGMTAIGTALAAVNKPVEDKLQKIGEEASKPKTFQEEMFGSMLTLSGILQALEGIVPLDNKLLFMTTNKPSDVDDALLRKGRIDHTYGLGALADVSVREYIELMFPGTHIHPGTRFLNIMGCDLQDLYFTHANDVDAFVASIPSEVSHLHAVQTQ